MGSIWWYGLCRATGILSVAAIDMEEVQGDLLVVLSAVRAGVAILRTGARSNCQLAAMMRYGHWSHSS